MLSFGSTARDVKDVEMYWNSDFPIKWLPDFLLWAQTDPPLLLLAAILWLWAKSGKIPSCFYFFKSPGCSFYSLAAHAQTTAYSIFCYVTSFLCFLCLITIMTLKLLMTRVQKVDWRDQTALSQQQVYGCKGVEIPSSVSWFGGVSLKGFRGYTHIHTLTHTHTHTHKQTVP